MSAKSQNNIKKQTDKNQNKKPGKNNNIYKLLTVLFALAFVLVLVLFIVTNRNSSNKAEENLVAAEAENTVTGSDTAQTDEQGTQAQDTKSTSDNSTAADSSVSDGAASDSTVAADSSVSEASAEETTEQSSSAVVRDPNKFLEEKGITIPELNLDWEKIKQDNEDIYAWLYIPGTTINYPVLQSATDDSYYLYHNIDGSEGYPGCLYTEATYNSKDFLDYNTIIYGHNMRDGSMFGALHDFEDEEFFNENRYAYIYLPDGTTYVYDLYAATAWNDSHIFMTYGFENEDEFLAFLVDVYDTRDMNAHYREEVDVGTANHVITLDTCQNGNDSQRFLVIGALINDPTLDHWQQVDLYDEIEE